jgi:hypothetical protein
MQYKKQFNSIFAHHQVFVNVLISVNIMNLNKLAIFGNKAKERIVIIIIDSTGV